MSQSPAVSDSSDFYGEEGQVDIQLQHNAAASDEYDPESPSSDAMEMDESPPASPECAVVNTAVSLANNTPANINTSISTTSAIKRKLSPVQDEPQLVLKRQKIIILPEKYFSTAVPRTAGLPAEVWQHIFLYLTPDSLSCCLSVNRGFNAYLTSVAGNMSIRLPPKRTGLKLIDSEAIWTSARKLFAPNLPRPLAGFSEMQMFQLLGGKCCQMCAIPPTAQTNARTPFDAGPGAHGVRIIWTFSTRMCGRCFDAASLKDTEILQSAAAPLRAGLPHAFRTNDLHYVPATTLHTSPAGAPRGGISKVYFRKHIENLQQEYEDAKEFGEAAAEEWVKGLPLNGKQQMADAARWERWEALHPPGTHPAKTLREYFRPISAPPASVSEHISAAAPPAVPAAIPPPNGTSLPVLPPHPMTHPLPARVIAVTQPQPAPQPITQSPPQNALPPQNNLAALQQGLAQSPQTQSGRPQAAPYRPPRNAKEVEEARASRKDEIERRCYEEFIPPLMPNVLQHMESFRAALMIVTPLTDQAWEVLKPRLYMQRDAAEQIEYQRGEQLRALQATIPDPLYRDSYSKSANEAAERQWEQQQGPVRKKLGKLADEFIRGKWNNGRGLSRDTAPAFAVEVLLYTRNKYVEKNTPKEQSNKEGPRYPSDPAFVSLENMRWLFDNKVKPLTEKHCRELFMCAECDGITKGYAFEGMIQHFGAKHTSDFSQGNIVVHWQTADWPDEPPFLPTVGEADPSFPPKQPAASTNSDFTAAPGPNSYSASHEPYSYPPPGSSQTQQPAAHAPPLPSALANLSAGQLEQLYAALNGQPLPAQPPYQEAPPQGYESGRIPSHSAPQKQTYSPYAAATTAAIASPAVPQFGSPVVSVHQDQLNEIAKISREIWDGMSGVKYLMESIKVQTVFDHVVKSFKARFRTEPSLDLITDALTNHALMRPIKNAQPLACKTCVSSSLGSTVYKPYHHRLADNKTYNISSLITHFKTVHLIGQDASSVDWKEDMIEMADDIQIKQLVSAPGMDDEKLAIFAETFPDMFPSPLPQIGRIVEREHRNDQDSNGRANKGNKKDKKKKNKRALQNVLDQDDAEQSDLPEAGEDEYDPRRPAFIETSGVAHGRGRRSLGGPPSNGHAIQAPAMNIPVITPETLAALSKLAPALNIQAPALPMLTGHSMPNAYAAGTGNEAAHRSNQRATYHPADPAANHTTHTHQQQSQEKEKRHKKERDTNKGRNRRSAAGVSGGEEPAEPEEDYTQVIRTAPASNGDYAAASLAQHPGVVPAVSPTRYAAERARGRSQHPEPTSYERVPVDQYGRPMPVAEPYHYEERERVQYLDEYGRPVQYVPPPREEVRYVDQYGRPVEVVRVVERPVYDRPMYDYPPQPHEYVPPPGHEYSAPPPGHEYGRPPPEHEYARPAEIPYDARRERVQYMDEYGRPILYGPPPTY